MDRRHGDRAEPGARGDDAISDPLPIGFEFPFYGRTFTTVRVCTNGFLSFDDDAVPVANQPLPSAGGVPNMIAPLWDDLDFGATPRAWVNGDGSRYVVEWVGVSRYGGGGGPYTFEVVLERSGEIQFRYQSLSGSPASATAGIQNGDRTDGTTVAFNTPYLHDGLAVRLVAPPARWVNVTPVAGRIPAGESRSLEVRIDAAGLGGGDLLTNILVTSNDPERLLHLVPARLVVAGGPDLELSATSLAFGDVSVGGSRTLALTLTNRGVTLLQVSGATASPAEFAADSSAFSLLPGQGRTLSVTYRPAALAPSSGALTIRSDDPDEGVSIVPLSGNGVSPARISVTPDPIPAVGVALGGETTRKITIHNDGGAPLGWSFAAVDPSAIAAFERGLATPVAGENAPKRAGAGSIPDARPTPTVAAVPWLTASPASDTVPARDSALVTLHYRTGSLPGGEYDALLTIASNDPAQRVFKRPVHFTVISIPELFLPTASVDFDTLVIGETRDRDFLIVNSGSGPLHVASASLSGDAYSWVVAGSFPATIVPGGSITLRLRFGSAVPCSPCNGEIVVVSDDPDHPVAHVAITGQMLAPPRIDMERDTLYAALANDLGERAQIRSRAVTIGNPGGSPLHVAVRLTGIFESSAGATAPGAKVSGPDNFGHIVVDSDEPGGPVFQWADITTIGTRLTLTGDDAIRTNVPIGFAFPFYGNAYSTVNVNVNGWLSFTSTLVASNIEQHLPDPRSFVPDNLIAPFWDNLTFGADRRAYVYNDGTRFIVSWVGAGASGGGDTYTFQVALYPNGRILFQYLSMTGGLESATVGIQNREKTDGLTVVYDAPYVHDSLAVVIPEPKPTWLFANPTDFEIPAGGSANLNVVLTSVGVPDGDHTGAIGITTDDPEHRFVTLPVALHVGTAEAAFALDPEHRSPAVPSGWVAGRLSGLDPCAPAAIRPASILAMDVVGLAPGSTVGLLDCGALDFRRMEMLANVPEGAASEIDVVGEVANETWFRALGTLRMQRPRLTRPAGRYAAGTSVALSWTDASGSPASRYDLWFSPDSGATWSPVASGLTLHAFAWTVPATFTNQGFLELLAHATSNGAFVGTTFSGPFGIDAPATAAPDPGAPTAFGVRLAGPQPARGTATLELAVPVRAPVEITLHDVRGAIVRRLARRTFEPGRHLVSWDGNGETGSAVAPGIYFVRMKTTTAFSTVRIALVR